MHYKCTLCVVYYDETGEVFVKLIVGYHVGMGWARLEKSMYIVSRSIVMRERETTIDTYIHYIIGSID